VRERWGDRVRERQGVGVMKRWGEVSAGFLYSRLENPDEREIANMVIT